MLSDTTAFITGASQGIGRKIALVLSEYGANVALAARSDGIYDVAEEIDAEDRTFPVETDVSDSDSVERAIEKTVETFGGLDALVNNAGIAGPTAPVEDVTIDEWNHTMDVNVAGMFRTTKYAVPYLKQSDRGTIVTISSISGKRPLPNRTPYTASKMAVIGFTRTLAAELGDDGITANAICPGATKGPRIDDVVEKQAEKLGVDFETAKRETFTDDALLSELTEPDAIAQFIAYLVSDHARQITAQDINIDAGTTWY